jgi:hypothetical protein
MDLQNKINVIKLWKNVISFIKSNSIIQETQDSNNELIWEYQQHNDLKK